MSGMNHHLQTGSGSLLTIDSLGPRGIRKEEGKRGEKKKKNKEKKKEIPKNPAWSRGTPRGISVRHTVYVYLPTRLIQVPCVDSWRILQSGPSSSISATLTRPVSFCAPYNFVLLGAM